MNLLKKLVKSYSDLLELHPLKTKVVTSSTLFGLSDVIG
jgi:hypothetical protein